MINSCSNEPYYMFLAQKLIENDAFKIFMLKMKDFQTCRNFCHEHLAEIVEENAKKSILRYNSKFYDF